MANNISIGSFSHSEFPWKVSLFSESLRGNTSATLAGGFFVLHSDQSLETI